MPNGAASKDAGSSDMDLLSFMAVCAWHIPRSKLLTSGYSEVDSDWS
jgi:hypothetical protein